MLMGEFQEPWKDLTTALVLDHQENRLEFDSLVNEPRVAGIIH
jgi:hypothetical protein